MCEWCVFQEQKCLAWQKKDLMAMWKFDLHWHTFYLLRSEINECHIDKCHIDKCSIDLNGTYTKYLNPVYKFLNTGFSKYFSPYLVPYHSGYNTRSSCRDGNLLVVQRFLPSIHKSAKQFGHSFSFNAATVWNALPDEVRASPRSIHSEGSLKLTYSTRPIHHNSIPSGRFRVADLFSAPGSMFLNTVFV